MNKKYCFLVYVIFKYDNFLQSLQIKNVLVP